MIALERLAKMSVKLTKIPPPPQKKGLQKFVLQILLY